MDRIIKFRAWNTKAKVMHSAEELGQDQLTLMPDGKGFINVSGSDVSLSQFYPHLTPLQYTGLTDINGKPIYEGDIITSSNFKMYGGRHTVEFNNYFHQWSGKIYLVHPIPIYQMKEIEIVGNIFENPELLKS